MVFDRATRFGDGVLQTLSSSDNLSHSFRTVRFPSIICRACPRLPQTAFDKLPPLSTFSFSRPLCTLSEFLKKQQRFFSVSQQISCFHLFLVPSLHFFWLHLALLLPSKMVRPDSPVPATNFPPSCFFLLFSQPILFTFPLAKFNFYHLGPPRLIDHLQAYSKPSQNKPLLFLLDLSTPYSAFRTHSSGAVLTFRFCSSPDSSLFVIDSRF